MKYHLAFAAGTVGALALLGAGCNPVANVEQKVAENVVQNTINQQTGGQAQVNLGDQGGVTYKDAKTGDYSAYGTDVKIPEDFPNDIPLYPGAKTAMVTWKGDHTEASLTQTTSDGAEKVDAALEDAIKAKGYTVASTISAGAAKIVTFEKDKVKMTISVASNTGGDIQTTITITRTTE